MTRGANQMSACIAQGGKTAIGGEADGGHEEIGRERGDICGKTELRRIESGAGLGVAFVHAGEIDAHVEHVRRVDGEDLIDAAAEVIAIERHALTSSMLPPRLSR